MMRTFQTRLGLDAASAGVLDAYAALHGRVERTLFAAMAKGEDPGKLKASYCARFGITARQFNAVANSIKGKVRSLQETQKLRVSDLKDRIKGLESKLPKLTGNKRHQKARRLGILRQRLAALDMDRKAGRLRICFGSRKLFNAQHHLSENGFASQRDWQQAWRSARADEVFVLGSKDETAGCQGCQLEPLGNNRFQVKLRLPHAIAAEGKHLAFEATFAYGAEALDAALKAGTALSFRFLRDEKGWRMFSSTEVQGAETISCVSGAMGVDLNADHLAVTETDAAGNPVATHRIDLITYGCTQDQAKARIGEAVKQVLYLAKAVGKPLVIEKLDFQRKKKDLKDSGVRYARMLSSLSYSRILDTLKARAFDAGIEVHEVNPAYTSIIGRKKFAQRYGLSSHGAAALVIARRASKFTERPNPSNGHVTSRVPARKRGEHVWSCWGRVLGGERRLQRTPGRRKAIPKVTGTKDKTLAHGTSGIPPGLVGEIPTRESVSSTVREASYAF